MADAKKNTCGIVMPISEIDGCSTSHWQEVLTIITDAAESHGFEARLVSDSDDVGVIQKRILQNLYENDIIVCDVSAKNANVMFELGLRLAFDKPAIVLKDNKTSYSFDTSPIEHLEYPRDLRYSEIIAFKEKLGAKMKATLEASKKKDYTTFLRHFGKFTVANIDTEVVSEQQLVLNELSELKSQIARLSRSSGGVSLEKKSRTMSLTELMRKSGDDRLTPLGSTSLLLATIKRGVQNSDISMSEITVSVEPAMRFLREAYPEIASNYGSELDLSQALKFVIDRIVET